MNIIEINSKTFPNLVELFPENFQGITINNQFLIFNNEQLDISKFNINDLLAEDCDFSFYVTSLSPQDTFNIIKIHSLLANNPALIPDNDELNYLLTKENLTSEEQQRLTTFLNIVGTLKIYETCLTKEAKDILKMFQTQLLNIQTQDENIPKTPGQNAFLKYHEILKKNEEQKAKKEQIDTPKLELKYKENSGNIGALEVIIITIAFATFLTFLTIYIIK